MGFFIVCHSDISLGVMEVGFKWGSESELGMTQSEIVKYNMYKVIY